MADPDIARLVDAAVPAELERRLAGFYAEVRPTGFAAVGGPEFIVRLPCEISGDDWLDFAAAWREAYDRVQGRPRLLTPLPRKARWRLWWHHRANSALIWLCRTPKGSALARRIWRL